MSMRRFTRLTNAFSKKIDNLEHAVALHFMYCNFARSHKAIANPYPRASAIAAGVSDHIWTIQRIVPLVCFEVTDYTLFHLLPRSRDDHGGNDCDNGN